MFRSLKIKNSIKKLSNPKKKNKAIDVLVELNAVEQCIDALDDEDTGICLGAVDTLHKLSDKRAVEALIEALENSSYHVRKGAATALGDLGKKQAVNGLIKALEDIEGDVRKNAANGLGKLGDKRAVEALIKRLGDKQEYVRKAAVEALGKLGDKKAAAPLIKLLGDTGKEICKAAVEALGKLGDKKAAAPLVELLGDTETGIRKAAVEALGMLGKSKWKKWVQGDKKDFERLVKLKNRDVVKPLIKALENENCNVRKIAAEALGNLGDSQAVEPLIKALEDQVFEIQEAVVEALDKLCDPRAVESLIKILESTEPYNEYISSYYIGGTGYTIKKYLRPTVINVLVRLGSPRAVEPIIKVLPDSDEELRKVIADALKRLSEPGWSKWIKGDIKDFGRMSLSGDEQAKQVGFKGLIKQLKSKSGYERKSAAKYLIRLSKNDPHLILNEWSNIAKLVNTPHDDYWQDACGHGHQVDKGIGLDFPEKPTHDLPDKYVPKDF